MTQEEKAKAYDKALELARVAAFNGHQSLMEGIFPELAESEDEKIRKEIINYLVEHDVDGYLLHADCEKWVAWLEKQAEPSIKWNKNTEGNKPQVNHSVLMKTTHGIAEGEWQGEYWLQYRWSSSIKDNDVLSWIELSDLEKQGEQKPAWSEEDKVKINRIVACLENLNVADNDILLKDVDWLKSLKQKIGE